MTLSLLLMQIAVIIAACWLVRRAMVPLRQPPVMGEILAGLLLGPSFFGWIAPQAYASLFPSSSLPALHGLSQIGLVVFMFLVGLRLDLSEVYAHRRVAGLSAFLSILLPFAIGLGLASFLYPFAASGTAKLPFQLFIAISMSITAFPVLARILTDRGLDSTRLGHVAISCAAVDDVTAWCLLAVTTAMAKSADGGSFSVAPLITVAAYVLLMGLPVRLALRALSARVAFSRHFPLILIFVFLSSWATESLGIHALFGAFLAGVIWPRPAGLVDEISRRLEPFAMAILIPLFFSYTGIRTNMGLLAGGLWIYALAVIALAVAGKAGGAFCGARLMGFGLRDSLALGCLLNTRGLVELIVLNVGLDLVILSPALFSIMVLMALTTTMMAAPALALILPEGFRTERPPSQALGLTSNTVAPGSSGE